MLNKNDLSGTTLTSPDGWITHILAPNTKQGGYYTQYINPHGVSVSFKRTTSFSPESLSELLAAGWTATPITDSAAAEGQEKINRDIARIEKMFRSIYPH